ncbi:hypothetical protein AGDE_14151 [Angomonas deanei]|uniref:Uncharacterized protein n=1 Tax=Angomonas deanei TaxID=59799 RepID=A0A7G2BYU0_9TRYP|nr:hypothetical protein AGDE_14151 [Angomonas deanei]CAD2212729.1 hypothetical protein, conserved [Angomonas deanei]|eukprot:EPY21341.1 hypothetical protein AGDE_14151 [Angomonas deanei]
MNIAFSAIVTTILFSDERSVGTVEEAETDAKVAAAPSKRRIPVRVCLVAKLTGGKEITLSSCMFNGEVAQHTVALKQPFVFNSGGAVDCLIVRAYTKDGQTPLAAEEATVYPVRLFGIQSTELTDEQMALLGR